LKLVSQHFLTVPARCFCGLRQARGSCTRHRSPNVNPRIHSTCARHLSHGMSHLHLASGITHEEPGPMHRAPPPTRHHEPHTRHHASAPGLRHATHGLATCTRGSATRHGIRGYDSVTCSRNRDLAPTRPVFDGVPLRLRAT